MRSLDDALPAAKAARASVSAVKNRPGEGEGGAAFRKTFADLGHARDTNAKTHASAGHTKTQPDEPAQITPTGSSAHTRQVGKADAVQTRTAEDFASTSKDAEAESDQTPHASVAHGAGGSKDRNSAVSSATPAGKTDALALLSIVTAPQSQDADGEAAVPPSSSDEATSESQTALPKTTQTVATATLSATLALKAIKADPEADSAGTAAGAATVPADDEKKVRAGKSPNTAEPKVAAPILVEKTLETLTTAVTSETVQKPGSDAPATLRVARAPAGSTSTDARTTAGNQPSAAVDSDSLPVPVIPAHLQAVAPEKIGVTKALDVVEPAADELSPHVAASSLLRQTKQVTTETTPEPAEDTAAAAPAPEMDIRSLMAILGPVTAQPAVDASAKGESSESEVRMPGLKVTGDRANMPMASMAAADSSALPTSTDGTDQVFRFARADGKVSPISLRADADRPASTASNDQANTKAETVTVLDARRYLGIAPTLGNPLPMTANAQAVAAAITGNGDPTQALQANTGSQAATGKVVNTLKIQMHPIDLGLVTATLRLRDDELQIDLRVQTGDAYRQLTNDQDAMIKALRAQGFQVDQVNVIFTPLDSAGGNDGSGQPQSNQQQPSQNGRDSQGGLAAGNGGEGRNGGAGQRSADDGRTRQDTLRETPAAPQPGLSDELYF
ncbi:flagellar hook-length control protein FliK [Rhizobium sp. PP-F2F-G36]|nr:flagellar hook-length control protein FliK [Rhizobium sp. PP-F2F-G36]